MQILPFNQPWYSWASSLSYPIILDLFTMGFVYSSYLKQFLLLTIGCLIFLKSDWFLLCSFFFFFLRASSCSQILYAAVNPGFVLRHHLVSVIHTMSSYSVSGLREHFKHWYSQLYTFRYSFLIISALVYSITYSKPSSNIY